MAESRVAKKKIEKDEKLTLDLIPEKLTAYCWQFQVSGHWCGGSKDDRWSTDRIQVLKAMLHCSHPVRLVIRDPERGILQGKILNHDEIEELLKV